MKNGINSIPAGVAMAFVMAVVFFLSCKKEVSDALIKPGVTITSPVPPSSGGTILRNILIQATAMPGDGKTIDRVEFYVDGVLIPGGTDTQAPYECAYEELSVFGQPRRITVMATDNDGSFDSTSVVVKFFNAVEKTPMPTSRYSFTASEFNGKIYVFGGGNFHFRTLEEYDPLTDTWTMKSPSVYGHAGAASYAFGGLIYVFGGSDTMTYVDQVEAYNPFNDTWTTKAPIPLDSGGAVGLSTASMYNGEIYLIGGEATTDPARIVKYDPVANTWALTNFYKTPYNAEAVTYQNTIYFMGGCPINSTGLCPNASDSMQTFNPNTGVWTNLAWMPSAHSGHASVEFNGKIYVFGGTLDSQSNQNCDVDCYDPSTNTWTSLADMPVGMMNFAACSSNGKIYLIDETHTYEYTPEQ